MPADAVVPDPGPDEPVIEIGDVSPYPCVDCGGPRPAWSWRCDLCEARRGEWRRLRYERFVYAVRRWVVFVFVVLILGGLVDLLGLAG
jgi:hypothetical protein